jgi:excisionase family DNA binding protein
MDSKQSDPKLFYRITAAAERLAISRSLAYELVQSGELPTVKFGRTMRVPASSLEEFARRKMVEAGLLPAGD